MDKRKSPPTSESSGAIVKRQRAEDESKALSIGKSSNSLTITGSQIKRTSGLQAPIMLLSGHSGEVFTCKFDPTGEFVASGSHDKTILLWNTYGDCINYGLIRGHAGPIMELHWSRDGSMIYSCSTDKTVSAWDAKSGERVKKFKGHSSFVNSCCPAPRGPEMIVSGSDDGTIRIWDLRQKEAVKVLDDGYPITATCFSLGGEMVFSGGVDNIVKAWDLRKDAIAYSLKGHMDTITGLRLSPSGSHLLSNAMDNTVRIWDVKPFASSSRLLKIFEGAPHGAERNLIKPAWSPDGERIACGSGDRTVVVWEVERQRILYKLPGHKGCVNEVDFHPREPILVSGSTDRNLFLGEINPN
ncbi:uncharacterized protein VTP21DRAFT_11409 [Calcarisporiella thermophila]|uniref:uncharacterized protein n=1 Tax=Calcarisporiella thermophila TaxID=911321 RepID=UPI0037433AE0